MTVKKTFSFQEINTDTDDVLKAIKNLRNDCSTGHDNIPVSLLKPGEKNHH